MGQLCWECDELLAMAPRQFDDKEGGGAFDALGGAVASIPNQFDDEPGSGFGDWLETINREAGASIVQIGDAVNPLVSIDDEEIEEARQNEDLAITGDNVITDQFDAQPGGGFADTTIGGLADVTGDVGNSLLDLGGDVFGGVLGAILDEILDNPILLGLALLVGVYAVGQLFDVNLGGSPA